MPLYYYNDIQPDIDASCFVAPNAIIIGDVQIQEQSSVWYNCTIRGDVHWIRIGCGTNIQDGSVLHVTKNKYPLDIKNFVTVGHAVTLHGCTIEDYALLGMGCIVLDQAVVEPESIVAAGALVKEKFIVPKHHLVAGVPAKVIRPLTAQEIENLHKSAHQYIEYSKIHANLRPVQ